MQLTQDEIQEMQKMRSYFPYRSITGVKLPNGEFSVFANGTRAQANNYARKNNGITFVFDFNQ